MKSLLKNSKSGKKMNIFRVFYNKKSIAKVANILMISFVIMFIIFIILLTTVSISDTPSGNTITKTYTFYFPKYQLPTNMTKNESYALWQNLKSTGNETGLKFWVANAKDKKTDIGWIPISGSCIGWTDKQLYDKDNNLILDDKIKPIALKCESSKCLENGTLKDCYFISLTSAQSVNINDYVKLGSDSSIVIYQNLSMINYNFENITFNITLYKNVSGEFKTQINDIFVYAQNESYKFGANDTSNTGTEQYKYVVEGNSKVYYNDRFIWFKTNEGGEYDIDFTDICLKNNSNCQVEKIDNNSAEFLFNSNYSIDPITSYYPNSTANGVNAWYEYTINGGSGWTWTECDANAYSAANLNTISADDGSYVTTGASQSTQQLKTCHRLIFNISQAPATITNMAVFVNWRFRGSGTGTLWVKTDIGNFTSSTWNLLNQTNSPTANTEYTHIYSITGAFTNYVNTSCGGGGGCVYLLLEAFNDYTAVGQLLHDIDFVQLNVTSTAADSTPPGVNITYPLNISYNINVSSLNYTVSDETGLSACWWSNNTGVWNSTTVTAGTNWTALTSIEGSNTWTVYCNDTSNNKNSTSVTFTKDTIYPVLNITYPLNISYNINVSSLNYTITELNPDSCWYSNNSGIWNSTKVTAGINFTGIISIEGSNTFILYCNDTVNNRNSTTITFTKDTVLPVLTITYPQNTSYNLATWLNSLNYTLIEANPSRCWYSNNSGAVNSTSVTAGTNFTNIGAIEGSNTFTLYCNDTVNNRNSTSVTFVKDTAGPTFSNTQANQTYALLWQNINFSTDVADGIKVDSIWFQSNFDAVLAATVNSSSLASTYYNFGLGMYQAQSFIASTTGYVTNLSIPLYRNSNIGVGDVNFQIRTDNANNPSNTILAFANLTGMSIALTPAYPYPYYTVNFTSPAQVTSGVRYWIVMQSNTSTATTRFRWQRAVNSLTSERGSSNYGVTWTSGTNDAAYKLSISTFPMKNETSSLINSATGSYSFIKKMNWVLSTPFTWLFCANDTSNNKACTSSNSFMVYTKSPTDTTPPNVYWVSYPNQKINGENIFLQGYATDNEQIKNISIFLQNNSQPIVLLAVNTTIGTPIYESYYFNSTPYATTDVLKFMLRAYDTSNNMNEVNITLTVDHNAPLLSSNPSPNPWITPSKPWYKNGNIITLRINATDGSGAGMAYIKADLTNINGTTYSNMTLESGSLATGNYATLNLTSTINTITGINKLIDFYVVDLASPTPNTANYTIGYNVDNTVPYHDSNSTSSPPFFQSQNVTFQIHLNDAHSGLDTWIYETNASGSFVNYTGILGGVSDSWIAISINQTELQSTYQWIYNDTVGNQNSTGFLIISMQIPTGVNLTVVNLVSPADGVNLTSTNFVFNVTNVSSSDIGACWINLNGVQNTINSSMLADINTILIVPGMIDDDYSWEICCNNTDSFESCSDMRSLRLDSTAPNATLISPPNATSTSNPTNNFTANLTDNLGIYNATLYIYNSTGNLINETTTNFISDTVEYTIGIIVNLVDDVYHWFYSLFDWAGNSYTSNNFTLTIDTLVPSNLIITFPLNISYNINVSSLNYTAIGADNCWYSTNGGNSNSTSSPTGINFTGITSIEGSNTFTLYCNDTANNKNSTSVTFTKDTIPPTVNLNISALLLEAGINTTIINATATDTSGISQFNLNITYPNGSIFYSLTGIIGSTQSTHGTFNIIGQYNVTAWANDTVGNIGINQSSFTVQDTLFPIVNITFPLNATKYNLVTWPDQLNYTYTDYTAGNCWYSNNTGAINSTITTAGINFTTINAIEGNNTFIVWCNDSANNKNSSSVTFFKDTVLPAITISSLLPNPAEYIVDIVYFNWSVFDINIDTAYFNVTNSTDSYIISLNITQNATISPIIFPNPDIYTFIVWANDTFGNTQTSAGALAVLSVFDTTPPNLIVHAPIAGTSYTLTTQPNILVNITANDTASAIDIAWWSVDDGLTNNTWDITEDIANWTYMIWNQVEGITKYYNLLVCANDTYDNRNCTTISLSIYIKPTSLQQPGGGGGGGGTWTNWTEESEPAPFPKPAPKPYEDPLIIKKTKEMWNYMANLLWPTNHAIGQGLLILIILALIFHQDIQNYLGRIKYKEEFK